MKYQYNFVDDLPQVMRRMPFNHLTAAFLRSFSEKQSLFFRRFSATLSTPHKDSFTEETTDFFRFYTRLITIIIVYI